jgi:hypothetical protein
MNLAVVNEAVTGMNGVEHEFTEEEKNFVVQFAFTNRIRGYQSLADRMRAISASKNTNLSDVTISKKLIAEENDHAVKTRVPGNMGKRCQICVAA